MKTRIVLISAALGASLFTFSSCKEDLALGIKPVESFAMAGDGVEISPSALPTVVQEFLANNYSEDNILKVEAYPKGYEVKLDNGMKLEFNLDGKFMEISGADDRHIPFFDLPAAIADYLMANYNGLSVVKAESEAGKIEITLSDDTKLEFTSEGKFIEVSGGGKRDDKGSDDNGNHANDPNHDANDDNGGGNDDGPNHDANDDNGGGNDDGPNHDANDDNGNHANDPNHDANDDNGGGNDDGPHHDVNDDKVGNNDDNSGKKDDNKNSGKNKGGDDNSGKGKGGGKDD